MDAVDWAETLLIQARTNQLARQHLFAGQIIVTKLIYDTPLTQDEQKIAAGIISCQIGNWLVEDIENREEKQ